ncbi:MAG: glycosyltransferase family 39 protein, partial [Nanoarchaeota archaeon]|nr:glycosyltransferase family 39 protein [Nanoarchaeota archaeon]
MEKEKKEFNFSWYIVLLILILIFAFTVRFYFFSDYKNQPIWWDESEHVLMAKHIAFGTPDTGYNASREIFVPLIFAFIFKIFNSELAVRFFQLLFSVGIVWLTYLVGKEIFNKKTGLIAAFIMAVFHLNLFFTLRFGLEIIAPFFALLTVYFFWKGYVKKENQKVFIPLMAVFAAFAFMSSAKIAFLLISMFLFLLITERFTFFKNKKLWFALIIFLILLTPYML